MSKKKALTAILALCLALGLAGCGSSRGADLIAGITARDSAKLCTVRMASEIQDPDGQVRYSSTATWDDAAGVRHMRDARSEAEANGSTTVTESEAWSDTERTYINTGSGWMERESGIGADRPAALDLDAAFSLIERFGKLTEKKDLSASDGEYGVTDVTFRTGFGDVRKLAGGAAENLKFDEATVTCRFRQGVLEGVFTEAGTAGGNDGYFHVDVTISAWNADGWDASIPSEITDPPVEQEIVIDQASPDPMKAYASEYIVPEDFGNEGLAAIAVTISENARYDKILAESHDGFDELQYHTHGAAGDGYWAAVFSVEAYQDADKAQARHAELQAFNDAWYGAGMPDGVWHAWEEHGKDSVHAEILCRDGRMRVILVQVEAPSVTDLEDGALTAIAKQIADSAGLDLE